MQVSTNCVACGVELVLEEGIPQSCWKCGADAAAKLERGDAEGAGADLVQVAVGVGLGLLAIGIIGALLGGGRK